MADIQILVTNDANRRALASVIDDQHTPITDPDLKPADLYFVDDISLPQYQDALEAHKREQAPIFCPVVLIRRDQTVVTVDLLTPDEREHPALVDEILTAPIDKHILFRRITNLQARRQQMMKVHEKKEQMEQFASMVNHEFRNSLNVLDGWLDVARERREEEAFNQCQFAVDQMKRIIGETGLLLGDGEYKLDRGVIDVGTACKASWEGVANSDASLELSTTQQIIADEDRLAQLLNNLFRNAVEHGGDEVTVTIGDLDDGFYIEDDGPGIPEDERESVFEQGYSTQNSGSGLGLVVVQKVADLHGWEVRVTDGDTVGARFEITDCGIDEKSEASVKVPD